MSATKNGFELWRFSGVLWTMNDCSHHPQFRGRVTQLNFNLWADSFDYLSCLATLGSLCIQMISPLSGRQAAAPLPPLWKNSLFLRGTYFYPEKFRKKNWKHTFIPICTNMKSALPLSSFVLPHHRVFRKRQQTGILNVHCTVSNRVA